jgi:hypothetical protein
MNRHKPPYLDCLKKEPCNLVTTSGHEVDVWTLSINTAFDHLATWAKIFRQNYCLDEKIDALRAGTGLTRSAFLMNLVFPDASVNPGPSIRAGDFAELLVADYLEYIQGYIVPKGKYAEKAVRNESVKGVDIIGIKFIDPQSFSPDDILIAFESKANCAGKSYTGQLQKAINDSNDKDYIRLSYTLNSIKIRLLNSGNDSMANKIERFQNITDNTYKYKSGAAAILSNHVYDESKIVDSDTSKHNNIDNLELLIIKGDNLMNLIHALYQEAANGAEKK